MCRREHFMFLLTFLWESKAMIAWCKSHHQIFENQSTICDWNENDDGKCWWHHQVFKQCVIFSSFYFGLIFAADFSPFFFLFCRFYWIQCELSIHSWLYPSALSFETHNFYVLCVSSIDRFRSISLYFYLEIFFTIKDGMGYAIVNSTKDSYSHIHIDKSFRIKC